MTAQARLYTVNDLKTMPDDGMRHELIEGKLIEMSRPGYSYSATVVRLASALQSALTSGGWVIPKLACHLAHDPDTLLIADVGYVSAERLPNPAPDAYLPFAPDLVVEVAESDKKWHSTFDRVHRYFERGARLFWRVNIQEQHVEVHDPSGHWEYVGRNEILNAGDVLPGFSLLVKTLFADKEEARGMSVTDLPTAVREQINSFRYDRIIEKHEGPERWEWAIRHAEITPIEGHNVILPIGSENRPNIEILRCIASQDGNTLTIFLKDRTFTRPKDEYFDAGRIAICDKIPGTDVFIAVVYHEWFAVENEGMP